MFAKVTDLDGCFNYVDDLAVLATAKHDRGLKRQL
jgi:hypothetical protein